MVSVIIPAYMSGKYLYEALDSALIQDVEMEILVIDDCPGDDTPDKLVQYIESRYTGKFTDKTTHGKKNKVHQDDGLCQKVLKKTRLRAECLVGDVRIRIYQNRANLGVAVVRNIGTALSEGEYVAFLDADDVWLPGKLNKQLKLLSDTGACLCNTARELIYDSGEKTGTIIHTPEKITLKMLEKTNYINCSAVVIKREVMLEYPMKYSNVHEDYYAWLSIMKKYRFAVGVDEPLILYRLSPRGKSRNKLKSALMTYRTYRYAGYSLPASAVMMFWYTINGLRKYRLTNIRRKKADKKVL